MNGPMGHSPVAANNGRLGSRKARKNQREPFLKSLGISQAAVGHWTSTTRAYSYWFVQLRCCAACHLSFFIGHF